MGLSLTVIRCGVCRAERCPALSEFSVENPLEKLAGRQMSGNRLWRAAVAVFAGYNYVLSIQDVSLDGKTMRQGCVRYAVKWIFH